MTSRSGSTSTTAPAPERFPVRAKDTPFVAALVDRPTRVVLPDRETTALPGEWLLTRGTSVIRVLSADQLAQEFDPVVPGALTLTKADCDALDETLGIGSTQSGPKLAKAVERLASIRIGEIRIPFTPGQLAELQYRAEKRGRTITQEMQAVVDRLKDELFYRGG